MKAEMKFPRSVKGYTSRGNLNLRTVLQIFEVIEEWQITGNGGLNTRVEWKTQEVQNKFNSNQAGEGILLDQINGGHSGAGIDHWHFWGLRRVANIAGGREFRCTQYQIYSLPVILVIYRMNCEVVKLSSFIGKSGYQ